MGEGHQVAVMGPLVAYVTKCVPVNVTVADYGNCTVEIPIIHRENGVETLRFMEPLMKVILDYPTEVVCSSLMPVRWHVDGHWYCSQPDLVPCPPPSQVYPRIGPYHATMEFAEEASKANLVKPSQLAQRDRLLARSNHREAVLHHLVSNSMDGARNGHIGSVFSTLEMDELTRSARNQVLGWLNPWFLVDEIGLWWWRVFSMLSFCTVVMTVSAATVRFAYQFAVYGWDSGRTLWRGILSCFGVFYVPKNMLKYVLGHTRQDLEQLGQTLRLIAQPRKGQGRPPPPPEPVEDPEPDLSAPPTYRSRASLWPELGRFLGRPRAHTADTEPTEAATSDPGTPPQPERNAPGGPRPPPSRPAAPPNPSVAASLPLLSEQGYSGVTLADAAQPGLTRTGQERPPPGTLERRQP